MANTKLIFPNNFVAPLMANIVVQDIMNDIKLGGCSHCSIIPDEYTDVYNMEQLTVGFQWASTKYLMF